MWVPRSQAFGAPTTGRGRGRNSIIPPGDTNPSGHPARTHATVVHTPTAHAACPVLTRVPSLPGSGGPSTPGSRHRGSTRRQRPMHCQIEAGHGPCARCPARARPARGQYIVPSSTRRRPARSGPVARVAESSLPCAGDVQSCSSGPTQIVWRFVARRCPSPVGPSSSLVGGLRFIPFVTRSQEGRRSP